MIIFFSAMYTIGTLLFYLLGDGDSTAWQTFNIVRLTMGAGMFAYTTFRRKKITVIDGLYLRWVMCLTSVLSLYTAICGYLTTKRDFQWIYDHSDYLAYLLSLLFILLIFFSVYLSKKQWINELLK